MLRRQAANRQSKLIFSMRRSDRTGSQTGAEEVLYRCDDGIPMLWVFAFGARNVWDPGDHVEDRGGAVGERNPYETQIEVALARIEHAEANLRSAAPLWFWFSALPLLRRKLLPKPRHGFVRVSAPWLASADDETAVSWRRAPSFAENVVNYVGAGDPSMAIRNLRELDPLCPFLPLGKLGDVNQLARVSAEAKDQDPAVSLALMTLGRPVLKEAFERGIHHDVEPALEKHEKLPAEAFRLPEPRVESASPTVESAPGGSLVGKLTGLFRREKPQSAPRS